MPGFSVKELISAGDTQDIAKHVSDAASKCSLRQHNQECVQNLSEHPAMHLLLKSSTGHSEGEHTVCSGVDLVPDLVPTLQQQQQQQQQPPICLDRKDLIEMYKSTLALVKYLTGGKQSDENSEKPKLANKDRRPETSDAEESHKDSTDKLMLPPDTRDFFGVPTFLPPSAYFLNLRFDGTQNLPYYGSSFFVDPSSPLGTYHGYRKPKRIRTAFSPSQLLRLESAFEVNHYVVGQERKKLAESLNLTETQVKVWFQNRRTKFKRIRLEERDVDTSDSEPHQQTSVSSNANIDVDEAEDELTSSDALRNDVGRESVLGSDLQIFDRGVNDKFSFTCPSSSASMYQSSGQPNFSCSKEERRITTIFGPTTTNTSFSLQTLATDFAMAEDRNHQPHHNMQCKMPGFPPTGDEVWRRYFQDGLNLPLPRLADGKLC